MEHRLNRGAADVRFRERRGVGDDRDQAAFLVGQLISGPMDDGQKVGSRKVLGGEDAIHGFERKLPPGMQEIGEMGLAQSGLTSQ
jgi:hypothetical protein